MFGLGVPEMLFILLLALLIFGPKRLPDIGRTLGKGLSEFRRASTELQRSINTDLAEVDRREERERKASPPSGEGSEGPAETLPREEEAAGDVEPSGEREPSTPGA